MVRAGRFPAKDETLSAKAVFLFMWYYEGMEVEITTNATEYIYIKPSTCGNCRFWDSKSDGLHKQCSRIYNAWDDIDNDDVLEKHPAYIMDSIIYTKAEFGCNLYQESEVEGE